MKFSLFDQFGALNSKPVFEAFKHGLTLYGHTVVHHAMDADVYVIWSVLWKGKMLKNKIIWDHAKNNNIPIIVLEIGGLKRGTTWKIGLNGINKFDNYIEPCYDDRHKRLGLELKPWKKTGTNILICCQQTDSELWSSNSTISCWISNTIRNIRKYSDRNIVIRPHPRDQSWVNDVYKELVQYPVKIANTYDSYDFEFQLDSTWCVVNVNSNPGIQSIIHGVPAFVDKSSLAFDVANHDYSMIEYPLTPDRTNWFNRLCHTEWTIDEIYLGIPVKYLYDKLYAIINA